MKHPLTLLFLALFLNIQCLSAQDTYANITYAGKTRTFNTHLPTGYTVTKKYPLVIGLHPTGQNASWSSFANLSQFSPKADAEGFIIVYPEGISQGNVRSWNAGSCCGAAVTQNIDDVGFINTLLDTIIARYPIDTMRVYATGFSNGGLMTFRLANQLTHRFAAVGIVGGDLVQFPWNPSRAIPIISIHSYVDPVISYYGNTSAMLGHFAPHDSIFKLINDDYNCLHRQDTVFYDKTSYTHLRSSDCPCGANIERYVTQDGSHSWPGGNADGPFAVSNKINATNLIWDFFKNYTRECSTVGVKDQLPAPQANFQVFPNPATQIITVRTNISGKLILLNQFGIKLREQTITEGETFISVSELPADCYFLQLFHPQDGLISVQKLLIVK